MIHFSLHSTLEGAAASTTHTLGTLDSRTHTLPLQSPSASSSIHAGSSSDAAGESDGDALGPLHTLDVEGTRGGEPDDGLTNPGDFDDLEDSRSFRVQEVDGVFMMLISMLGTPGGPQDREPAMAQVQFQLGSKSADASLVVQDTRLPSVQAMVTQSQPGAGRLLQLTAQHRYGGDSPIAVFL